MKILKSSPSDIVTLHLSGAEYDATLSAIHYISEVKIDPTMAAITGLDMEAIHKMKKDIENGA